MDEALSTLADDYWQWRLRTSPTLALVLGDHRYDEQFEDASLEAEDVQIAELRSFETAAAAIDPAELADDDRITRDLLVFETSTAADRLAGRFAHIGANHAIGPAALLPTRITQFPLTEATHAAAMVPKYEAMARHVRQLADRLREGAAQGRTSHAHTVNRTIEQVERYLGSPTADDPYLQLPAPSTMDEAATADWRQRITTTIETHVRPAWQAYLETLRADVAPHARPDDAPSICMLPGGDDVYRRAIRRHTSVDLSADEIHRIGLEQIERLADEYREVGQQVLGTSDLTEIFDRLRDDPQFRFERGEDVVTKSEIAMATASAAMGDWFGRLPRAGCEVREVASGPVAFYQVPASDGSRPGTFYVNTGDPSSWQTFDVESMAFHEGIPGHHLQLAIADELVGLPEFRKRAGVTAYIEGWGLYAERLADEMGIYSSPLDRLGILGADSMRAGRLVVDTGMHAMGWSRSEAVEFLHQNGPSTISSIEAEVDRYLGMPGQALAYMVGRLEIVKYRRQAEATMGERFDIKGFHDVVLGSGIVTLPMLERLVDSWAASA